MLPYWFAVRQGNEHNYMLCIIALSCFFLAHFRHGGGGWSAWFLFCLVCGLAYWFFWGTRKSNVPIVGGLQKVWQKKNNSRVDCAEAGKKTLQTQHFGMLNDRRFDRLSGQRAKWADEKGWGFLPAGDCPGGAARNLLTGIAWPLVLTTWHWHTLQKGWLFFLDQ